MLNCGHSFCETCLEGIFKRDQKVTPGLLVCPVCLIEHSIPNGQEGLSKLVKNFTLLSLIETAKLASLPKTPEAAQKAATQPSLEEEYKLEEQEPIEQED
jgi:hypothetical protein